MLYMKANETVKILPSVLFQVYSASGKPSDRLEKNFFSTVNHFLHMTDS